VGAEQIPVLARIAAQSGARRLILLSPQSAFLQLSVPGNAAIQLREVALVALGFDTLVILRPAQDYANAQGSALARLAAWGAKAVLEIVIPQRLQPLPAGQIAQAAIDAATFGPGVHILSGGQIAGLAAGAQRWRPAGTGSGIVV
jgi:hypothetical protein